MGAYAGRGVSSTANRRAYAWTLLPR